MPPIDPVARLEFIGFQLAGQWTVGAGCLTCQLSTLEKAKNVLYAFVTGDQVLYVGKTIQPLRTRMRGYERPEQSQSTNVRSNAKLKELLDGGHEIRVLVLPDNGLLRYGGFHVNLAAGLEDSIIRELRPAWNVTGTR